MKELSIEEMTSLRAGQPVANSGSITQTSGAVAFSSSVAFAPINAAGGSAEESFAVLINTGNSVHIG